MSVLISAAVKRLIAKMASNGGAAMVGYVQAAAGAVVRTVQEKIYERPASAYDFFSVTQIAKIKTGDASFDPTPILQAAINAVPELEVPPGIYRISSELRIKKRDFRLLGAGSARTVFKAVAAMDKVIGVYGADDNIDSLINNISLHGFAVNGNALAENGLFVTTCLSLDLYKDIDITGCKSYGLNHHRGFTCRGVAVRCHDNIGTGYVLGQEVNQCDFDIEADNNGGHGGVVLGADGLRIAGGVENNGANGLYVVSTRIPNIHGLDIALRYVENNGTSNRALYAGIKLATAGPGNVMQSVRIGPLFLNIAGETGIHVGPNILGLEIGAIAHLNGGAGKPLVLSAEYISLPTAKTARIKVNPSSTITPAHLGVETATAGQVVATAEYIFDSLDIERGIALEPRVYSAGADVGRTYGVATGSASKAGDRCAFTMQVNVTGKGSSVGLLEVAGLPFASAEAIFTPVEIVASGLTYSGSLVALIPPAPAREIRLYSQVSGAAPVVLDAAAIPAGGCTLYVSGSYRIR